MSKRRAERLVSDGAAAEANGDRLGAHACYREALTLNAVVGEALLRRALQARPDLHEARAALFHALEGRGDLSAAADELEAALRHRPEWTEAFYNYGSVLATLRRE